MKIKLITPLLLVAATLPAAASTIVDWTFETTPPVNVTAATFGPYAADVGTGTLTASHASATTAYSHQVGNGSANSISSSMWAMNDYYQFSLSTLGFSSIQLSYDQTGSATGPDKFKLAVSTDGGATFSDVGSIYSLPNPAVSWASGTPNASGSTTFSSSFGATLDDETSVIFRVIDESITAGGAINGGNVGTTGTDRIDNFLVTGTSLTASAAPEQSSTLALLSTSLVGLGFLARRRK